MRRTSDWEHEEHDEDCTLGKTKLSKGTTPGEREGNFGERGNVHEVKWNEIDFKV